MGKNADAEVRERTGAFALDVTFKKLFIHYSHYSRLLTQILFENYRSVDPIPLMRKSTVICPFFYILFQLLFVSLKGQAILRPIKVLPVDISDKAYQKSNYIVKEETRIRHFMDSIYAIDSSTDKADRLLSKKDYNFYYKYNDGPAGVDAHLNWYVGSAGDCDTWYDLYMEYQYDYKKDEYIGVPIIRKASSTLPHHILKYTADQAEDFDLRTAWVEGKKGNGTGEYIEYRYVRFRDTKPITTLIIYNGYHKSEKAWKENSRVKKMKLYINAKIKAILQLRDATGGQVFDVSRFFSDTMKNIIVRLEIQDVYPGTLYDDVAISELEIAGAGGCCLVSGTKIAMADGSVKNIEELITGDRILSYDFETGKTEPAVVQKINSQLHRELVIYEGASFSLIATPDHPVYIKDKGWCTLKNIQTGDKVLANQSSISEVSIMKITSSNKQGQKTFTISQLSKNQAYFANGILVKVE